MKIRDYCFSIDFFSPVLIEGEIRRLLKVARREDGLHQTHEDIKIPGEVIALP